MKESNFFEQCVLHEDLEVYVENLGDIWVLRHPLVVMVPYEKGLNGIVNKMYEQKLIQVGNAKKRENWSEFIYLHEKPYRLDAFKQNLDFYDDVAYWSLLGSIWTGCENIGQQLSDWKELLCSERPRKEMFMGESDREVFRRLPAKVVIWRGGTEEGLSYSLSKNTAEWFANRFGKNYSVFKKVVQKKDLFAFINSRGEEEVIYLYNRE